MLFDDYTSVIVDQIHGFSSRMKFIIFLIFIPLVHSELHRFITTYTGISGQTFAGTPEFSAVTSLDGHQIDYYDSNIKKMIPKQDWMKEFVSKDTWTEDTEIRKHVQQVYKNNIHVLMQRFSQSQGVHSYQRVYGCEWDDHTEESQGFDKYSYDGRDFISLGVKERTYTAHVPQAEPTVEKWNKDEDQLKLLKRYYEHECVYWLTYFLELRKAGFKRRGPTKDYTVLYVVGVLVICAFVLMKRGILQKLRRFLLNEPCYYNRLISRSNYP
ncbi:class I histocompatibility antigen, F10 alpha chain-like [Chanodichthys erythropterus]|uniref:class I histocompatibility antigen, F10 alpha chain-like n=1 Tax=Chanodichthys erythropterus TaxID=933992 RepID=UPI00351ED5A8